jgi:protein TonB
MPLTKQEQKEPAPPLKYVPEFVLVDDASELDDPNLDIFNTEITDEGIDVNALINNRGDEIDKEEIFEIHRVDEMPEFPGGMGALISYLGKTVDYPVIAQENGIQGKVYVAFVINSDGQVSDAKVIRGVDGSLDKEALRVVNGMPKWKPGKQSGRAVRVSFNVPISFVLQ